MDIHSHGISYQNDENGIDQYNLVVAVQWDGRSVNPFYKRHLICDGFIYLEGGLRSREMICLVCSITATSLEL